MVCKVCGGETKHRDWVKRIVRYGEGDPLWIKVERVKCVSCGHLQRVLPSFVEPYKQYDKRIISDVVHNRITPDTIGHEDFPCEMTMNRWKESNIRSQNGHLL